MCYKDVVFIRGTWVEENHQAFNFALEKLVSLQKAILWPPLYRVGTAFSKQYHVVKKKKKNALLIRLPLANVPNPGWRAVLWFSQQLTLSLYHGNNLLLKPRKQIDCTKDISPCH